MAGLFSVSKTQPKQVCDCVPLAGISIKNPSFSDRLKQLVGRIYQFVLSIFKGISRGLVYIKDSAKAGLTALLEAILRRLGNPSSNKIHLLEAELKVNHEALRLLKAEYAALLVTPRPVPVPVAPIAGAPADANKAIALLNQQLKQAAQDLALAHKERAKEQAEKAQIAAQIQALKPVKIELAAAQSKIDLLNGLKATLERRITELDKDLKKAQANLKGQNPGASSSNVSS